MTEALNDQDPQPQHDETQPDPLEELRRERDALQDRLLRTAAEFDNYRKRMDRERRDLAEYTAGEVITELLPIIDNLERALQASAPDDPLRKGVELIHKQMLDMLRKRGVTPIEALGADFDPNFHQAVIHEESAQHREGEVMEELQRGYVVGDRLLRPAMVKVAKTRVSKRDYYEILSVTRTATEQEIKSSYRKLALKFHPDRNPGDKESEERFKEAAEAYAVLIDTDKRHMYDRFGHAGLGGAATGGFDPNAFSGFEDILGGLGDIFGFGDVFGGGRRRGGPQRGADLRYDLEISFNEAAKGVEASIQIPRQVACETCGGSGAAAGTQPVTCPQCQGRGQLRYQQGFFTVARTCNQCRGSGSIISKPCATCRGAGRVQQEKKLTVRIPAGIATGQRLRLSSEGEAGPAGWSARRPVRRDPRAGPPVLPARRQRPLLRSAAELHDARARRRDSHSRRSMATSPSTFRPARRPARRSAFAAGACPTSAAAATATCSSR